MVFGKRTRSTYTSVQAFYTLYAVMTDVQFIQLCQRVKTLNLLQAVALNKKGRHKWIVENKGRHKWIVENKGRHKWIVENKGRHKWIVENKGRQKWIVENKGRHKWIVENKGET